MLMGKKLYLTLSKGINQNSIKNSIKIKIFDFACLQMNNRPLFMNYFKRRPMLIDFYPLQVILRWWSSYPLHIVSTQNHVLF